MFWIGACEAVHPARREHSRSFAAPASPRCLTHPSVFVSHEIHVPLKTHQCETHVCRYCGCKADMVRAVRAERRVSAAHRRNRAALSVDCSMGDQTRLSRRETRAAPLWICVRCWWCRREHTQGFLGASAGRSQCAARCVQPHGH